MQNRCSVPAQCGTFCSSDFDCLSAPRPCTACVDRGCRQQPFCGSSCTNDYQCVRASNGCTACLGYRCSIPNTVVTPTCGSFCQSDNQCSSARDGCIYCNLNVRQCSAQRNPSGCISDLNGLNNAVIGNSQSIFLCANAQITLTSTVTVNRQGQIFNLQCQSGVGCVIRGNRSFPLITIFANSVSITGITFQDGRSSNNVRIFTYHDSYLLFFINVSLITVKSLFLILQREERYL